MKTLHPIVRIKKSIFTKLIIIIAITGLAIHMVSREIFRKYVASERHRSFVQNLAAFADYIISDIGFPPDIAKANSIARSTTVHIGVERGDWSWYSSGKRPYYAPHRPVILPNEGKIFFRPGGFVYVKESGGYRYLFYPHKKTSWKGNNEMLLVLFLAITLVLGIAYIVIRKIFRPITLLAAGVREVSRGNLDYRVPVGAADELGALAESFNAMNERLRFMLKAKEQLLIDVSHELRSPLTRIKVTLEFLTDLKLKTAIGDDIAEIEKMIAEIIETERLTHPGGGLNPEDCDLAPLIRELSRDLRIDDHRLIMDDTNPVRQVRADRERTAVVLRNILENAVKYTDPERLYITVVFAEDDGSRTVTIADNGYGIPREHLPFIFEPFYRVDPSRSRQTGGYGLGMNICKKIMEAHGGSIAIDSDPGAGTRITLRFPHNAV